jgi:hypothetical protein
LHPTALISRMVASRHRPSDREHHASRPSRNSATGFTRLTGIGSFGAITDGMPPVPT